MTIDYRYKQTSEFDRWLADNGPLDVSQYVEELDRAEREGLTERQIDDYDPVTEEQIWRETKERSEHGRRWFFGPWQSRPAQSFHLQTKLIREALRKDGKCRAVVDFGALYAKPDADIAELFRM